MKYFKKLIYLFISSYLFLAMSSPPFITKHGRVYSDTLSPRSDTLVQTNVTIMDTGHIIQFSAGNSKNIADILWFGNVYGDTGDFNRIIVNDLEITDTVESLKADGEAYFIFGKDDYSPLWEFQRDGDNLDLYSNISASTVAKFNGSGSIELNKVYFIDSSSSVSGAVNIDLSTHNVFYLTLTGNITSLTYSNATKGGNYKILLIQDGTGGRSVTFGSNWLAPNGIVHVDDDASSKTLITGFYDGSKMIISELSYLSAP